MGLSKTIYSNPIEYLRAESPENPVLFFAPSAVQTAARRFIAGFAGLVTYAVKANPSEEMIENLLAAGLRGFDCASPFEIALIRRLAPDAAIHYHNPVRSLREIEFARTHKVTSYSVDSASELNKLIAHIPAQMGAKQVEISVRFKMPIAGAAYNFGAKFGATSDLAVSLLQAVARAGYTPSLTFHGGTQCNDPQVWAAYIQEAATIAAKAGVKIARLNVGGGFPNHRSKAISPDYDAIFRAIETSARAAFGDDLPALVCEPGRALCGDAFALAARVKAMRDEAHVFLNDGLYGAMFEFGQIGVIDRFTVLAPDLSPRQGAQTPRTTFGPTCDSVDRLPGEVDFPADMAEGDYILFQGMGSYSTVTNTRFNGFGELGMATVLSLD